jgi:hypothetical protein
MSLALESNRVQLAQATLHYFESLPPRALAGEFTTAICLNRARKLVDVDSNV